MTHSVPISLSLKPWYSATGSDGMIVPPLIRTSSPAMRLDRTKTPMGKHVPLSSQTSGAATGYSTKSLDTGPENPTINGSTKILGVGAMIALNSPKKSHEHQTTRCCQHQWIVHRRVAHVLLNWLGPGQLV